MKPAAWIDRLRQAAPTALVVDAAMESADSQRGGAASISPASSDLIAGAAVATCSLHDARQWLGVEQFRRAFAGPNSRPVLEAIAAGAVLR